MSATNRTPWQRLLALLLCVVMVLPLMPLDALATGLDQAVSGLVEKQANANAFTILAASDFQAKPTDGAADSYASANANGAATVSAIASQVKRAGHDVDAFFFCGDYSLSNDNATVTQNAYTALNKALTDKGVNPAQSVYVQGNHDPDMSFIKTTGGYSAEKYHYYVLNEDEYSFGGGTEAGVQRIAADMESWLSGLTVGEKPVFILSHVPLHYSVRTYNAYDAQYARYLVDVLNAAGQRGLNIFFLFGHNHSGSYDAYIGGSTSYIAKGDVLWVSNTRNARLTPEAQPINFTYMNAGYVGYYEATSGTDAMQTMSVFEVVGDDVTIYRYDSNGQHGLKPYAGKFGTDSRESSFGHQPNANIFSGSVSVAGNDLEVTIPELIRKNRMALGFQATVSANVAAGSTCTWTSSNPSVVSVEEGSGGTATLHAKSLGTARITVKATAASAASADDYAVMDAGTQAAASGTTSFYVTVSDSAVEVTDGVYYKLVTAMNESRRYLLVNSKSAGSAYAIKAAASGTALMAPTALPVDVNVYMAGRPYVVLNSADSYALWDFKNVDSSNGNGVLYNAARTSDRLGFGTFSNGTWRGMSILSASASPAYIGWNYSNDTGIYSYVQYKEGEEPSIGKVGGQQIFLSRYYDPRAGFNTDSWAAVCAGALDPDYFSKVYAYEETPRTYTLSLSEKIGEVAVGGTDTGTQILKTWCTGEVEYIPLTTAHLSVGSGTEGVYSDVSVTYEDLVISNDYILIVGGDAGDATEHTGDYYYRLTDRLRMSEDFNSEHRYLILNRNTAGDGQMMVADGYSDHGVLSAGVTVTTDADGVPCVLPSNLPSGSLVHQEWWYHNHSDGNWYLWQPNWSDGDNNYLRIAAATGGVAVTGGSADTHALKNPQFSKSASITDYDYTTVNGTLDAASGNKLYLQYQDNQFKGVLAAGRADNTEVYIYEKVYYDQAPEIDNGEVFYKLADTLANGKKYILSHKTDGGHPYTIMKTDSNALTYEDPNELMIGSYRKGMPFMHKSVSGSDQNLWVYKNGYLQTPSEASKHLAVNTSDVYGTAYGMYNEVIDGDAAKWSADASDGVRSMLLDSNGDNYRLTFYINSGDSTSNLTWRLAGAGSYDPDYYKQVYAFVQAPLYATVTLSDKSCTVAQGTASDTEVGPMVVLTWSNGRVEYVPMTAEMLGVDTSTAAAGEYITSVTYEGKVITRSFKLTIGAPKTVSVAEGYYYRLTTDFERIEGGLNKEKRYVIVSRNTKGDAKMMEATCYGGNGVTAAGVLVDLDADGVPAIRSYNMANATLDHTGSPVFREWYYHNHSDGNWYLWQPNWKDSDSVDNGDGCNNNIRIAALNSGTVVGGAVDPNALVTPTFAASGTQRVKGYTTVRGSLPAHKDSNGNAVTYYLQYRDTAEPFYGVSDLYRMPGSEVYIYEKVKYTTAEVAPESYVGVVTAGSAATGTTGTYVLMTYPDGRVERIPVTANMLSDANGALNDADLKEAKTLTGLTLKYNGITLTDSYTLKVKAPGAAPAEGEPGYVGVDKQKDTTEYNYEETGVARVDLTTSGIPAQAPVDVLLVLDTSASMEMYTAKNGKTRLEVMCEAVDYLVDELAHPNADGTLPEINLAISEFNNYNYFSTDNTFNGTDDLGREYESRGWKNWNANGLVKDYTSIYEMQNYNAAEIQEKNGTNYDIAFQKAYEIISARKAAHPDHEQVVIFMTDGITYQYNYMSYNGEPSLDDLWARWLEGKLTADELSDTNTRIPASARVHFYNPDGNKQWMAEAIKGYADTNYKVIWNENTTVVAGYNYSDANNLKYKPGLDATIYSIGYGVYVDGEAAVRIADYILGNVASDPTKYYKADTVDDLMDAFAEIGHGVRYAATNAQFYDQLGEEFDLQMKAVFNSRDEKATVNPSIVIKAYDVYKYSEVGTVVYGVEVTPELVGKRKNNTPTILEKVTFNASGTKAYSTKCDVNGDGVCNTEDNIMVNGIINAYYFMYNTEEYDPDEFSYAIPAPETFQWNIGEITERELVMSYYVYLEDAMGVNGGHEREITVNTNNYAELHYVDDQGVSHTLATESPKLYWKDAQVNYGFYLVDENGVPIKENGNFVIVQAAGNDQRINLNTDNTLYASGQKIPAGYGLYDPNASATVHSNSGTSTGGSWTLVGDNGTTYLGTPTTALTNKNGSTKTGEYDQTTVWFAVVQYDENPVTDKTVAATGNANEFILTLEAYTQGEQSTISVAKPADIVLVLDHSASMRTPVGAPSVLQSGTWYGGEGQLTKSDLSTTLGAHPGYYVAQDRTDNYWYVLLYHTDNRWYGYKVNSTEGIIEYLYANGTAAQADGKYADHIDRKSWNSISAMPDTFVFYKSQYAALYDSVKEFVADLEASGVEHRVAITGFSGSTFGGSVLYLYADGFTTLHYNTLQSLDQATKTAAYQGALKNIQNETQYEQLQTAIDAIDARYLFTCPAVGLSMATDLFAANAVDLEERDRVVVLFTDGIPNKKIGSDHNDEDEPTAIYNEIVTIAKKAKDQGAKVFTISTTTLSEGADRTFLHYASSDYPNATDYNNPGTPIAKEKYTMRAENMEDFGKIFNTITQDVVGNNTDLDENTVLREVLTDYFVLNPEDETAVTVYKVPYNGNGTWGDKQKFTGATVELSSTEGTGGRKDVIEVSGFNYKTEYISNVARNGYYGSKLLVEVKIKTRDGFWGGNNVPTNKATTGIYNGNTLVKDFPEPQVNVPINVKVDVHDKTVYCRNTIDSDKDGNEGDELITSVTIGGQKVTINENNGTFSPTQSWMDDFAEASWSNGSTTPSSDLSTVTPADYPYSVTVKPTSDGTSNPNGNIVGTATDKTKGVSDSDTGHVYVLVPELTFKDSVTDFGTDAGSYDYNANDYVPSETKWVDSKTREEPSTSGNHTGIPALEPDQTAPALTLTYEPVDSNLEDGKFVKNTKVNVTVKRADSGISLNPVAYFNWQNCDAEEHGNCGSINSHKGDASGPEFWVHVNIQILPDTVVIDFGLPVNIDPLTNDMANVTGVAKALTGIRVKDTGKFVTVVNSNVDGTYGVAVRQSDTIVRYTLNDASTQKNNGMQMEKEEVFDYQGSYTVGKTSVEASSTITVIPATIIYYEDTFVTYTNHGAAWEAVGTLDSVQATDRPGTNQIGEDLNNIYGYDGAYVDGKAEEDANKEDYSLDTYHQITVSGSNYGKATFTFTGTAFDVIALSSGTTGTISVSVHSAATPTDANRICLYMVDTYYGYTYTNGEWVITDPTNPSALYQVPVMKVDMANHTDHADVGENGYGTYTVVITVAYNELFDHGQYGENGTKAGKYDFMLDAIRIYDPANDGKKNDGTYNETIKDAYEKDGEGWPSYTELRNILITANTFDSLGKTDEATGIIFIDGIPELDKEHNSNTGSDVSDNVATKEPGIQDYANFGPNNELYLAPGQGVAFKLNASSNVQNVHLALKSVGGTANVKVFDAADTSKTNVLTGTADAASIATATDLYYSINDLKNDTVIIVNAGSTAEGSTDAILSITNIKMTYGSDPGVAAAEHNFVVSREMAELVLASLTPEPANPFSDVAEGAYYYDGILWAVRNGITQGVTDTTFAPGATCNRGQIVTFLWRAAGSPEPTLQKHPFVDISQNSFYYKAVLWAVENGITNGIDATHFAPNATCTRAQVVTFLWRAMGSPEPASTEHPFTDVQEGGFYHKAMLWASENGITNGMTATAFGPNITCTRGQVVTFLYRAYTTE